MTTSDSAEARQLAGIAHVLGIFFGFIGPLIIFLTQRGKNAFVTDHAKEALNFQITVALALIANAILGWALGFVWFLIGWAVPLALFVVVVWWSILGFQATSRGDSYRYPFAFRLVG